MKALIYAPELPFIDTEGQYVDKGKEFTMGGIANASKYIIDGLARHTERLDVISHNRFYSQEKNIVQHKEGEGSITQINCDWFQKNTTSKERLDKLISSYLTNTQELTSQHEYDVMLIIGGLAESITAHFMNLTPTQFGLKKKIPYVISLRGSEVPNHHPVINYGPEFGYMIKQIWQDASIICSNSHHLASEAKAFLPESDFPVIPNGVDMKLFSPRESETIPDELRLIYAGRVAPIKGLENAIRAIHSLDKLNIKFNIHGYLRYYTTEITDLTDSLGISDKVELHGSYSNADLPDILAKNDIFILPSHNEGDSNSLKQAMAAGLPIIATRVGTVPDFLGRDLEIPCGYTIPPKDEFALASAIKKAFENKPKLSLMGKKSRENVEMYSWGKIAYQYYNLLNAAIAN